MQSTDKEALKEENLMMKKLISKHTAAFFIMDIVFTHKFQLNFGRI